MIAVRLFVSCLGLGALSTFSSAAFAEAPGKDHVADQPQIAYTYFTRPRAMGEDYDTWRHAKGPDVGEVKVDPARLPSRVDNSQRPEYPPVYRQRYGACGQFAAVASVFTYEMNVLTGKAADSDATRFPAHFSWNMINRGENKGSEAYHGWEVAIHHGVPTAESYGGVRHDTIGIWPDGYDVWHEALTYRVTGYRYTPVVTPEQVAEVKGWLFDRNQPQEGQQSAGGILAIDGRMGDQKDATVTIPEGQHGAGEDLWKTWCPTGYGHGMACVGYDDQIGYDLNGDGKITNDIDINGDNQVTLADWERGAYIIVNSWGDRWSGDGKIYLLYSAMADPTWKRGNYLGRVEVARHQPRLTLRLKLACTNRSALRMTVGIATDPHAQAPEAEYEPQAFNGWPIFGRSNAGDHPMAGPGNDEPIEVAVDLTSLLDQLGLQALTSGRVFVRLSTAEGVEATGQLHEASLRRYDQKGDLFQETPIPAGDGTFGQTEWQKGLTIPKAADPA